ncbi:DUF4402 domain-containing protein [Novosphingobium sp. FSY-8]|uniref:DUF4402 domain-containing protein n=1 Tax=Novosphingobium ovatum TaxID=1908523 RepID=A0ABW9XEE2_9SPHN|nr:DUF4402 domain-containing protein [Novosphingobium ovatum]NBC36885.1 DUF4402 domain-containing protein [Novosphingobium ovatum]
MRRLMITAALLCTAVAGTAHAGGNASARSGDATARVVSPVTLIHGRIATGLMAAASTTQSVASATLSFGKFTTGSGGGHVTVSTGSSGSVAGDVQFVSDSSVSADVFSITGDAQRAYTVATTSGTVTYGNYSMSFTTTPSKSAGTLNILGRDTFTVGGTLEVPAQIAPGVYSGSYAALLTYN